MANLDEYTQEEFSARFREVLYTILIGGYYIAQLQERLDELKAQ